MADEEFGSWVEYHGEGYFRGVRLGMIVQIEVLYRGNFVRSEPMVVDRDIMFKSIVEGPDEKILRFRIKRPKGLTILESLIADIPAPTNPKVDA